MAHEFEANNQRRLGGGGVGGGGLGVTVIANSPP